jgi:hypothetical protein
MDAHWLIYDITNKKQLLDKVEQNIVICQWRAITYLPMPSLVPSNVYTVIDQ